MAHKYETLRTLFEKTDAFNENGLTLFQQLRELVWSKLENYSTQNEILLINRYDSMIKELEILIRTQDAQAIKDKAKQKPNKSGKAPIVLGG